MGLITKGMGAILKGAKKGSKKVVKRVKEDAPFIGAVGAVDVGRRVYNKLTQKDVKGRPHSTKPDPGEGTLSGIAVMITKDVKKKIKDKKKSGKK